MRSLTIKQRLIAMTVILSLLITGLSLIFINRFGAMAKTYQQIPKMHVPQQQVSAAMVQVLLKEEMNVNKLRDIENDITEFEGLVEASEENLDKYRMLDKALLNGSSDLSQEISGFMNISVEKAVADGEMESLIFKANANFTSFVESFNLFIEKKREYLQVKNKLGWYGETSQKGNTGLVKKMADLRNKLGSYATSTTQTFYIEELAENERSLLLNFSPGSIKRFNEMVSETNSSVFMFTIDPSVAKEAKNLLDEYIQTGKAAMDRLEVLQGMEKEIEQILSNEIMPQIAALSNSVNQIKSQANEQINTASVSAIDMEKSSKTLITLISILVIGFGLTFGWLVSAKINKILSAIIQGLGESSEQVASASAQVSASSQSMSEGSSQQASSIEETSSSLEEMSSMTKQNAEHANQADNLMKESNQIVTQANESMTNLTVSMEEISKASDETSKIIKTIDEIAFQTNLLALNAAVEAARAGEAGAGFAVVADEVRNLAMRAAEAAKNTSQLIEGTVKKIKDGSGLVTDTNDAFTHVSQSASKVGELVAEIAAASREQAQGIQQVNDSVMEMDKVVQQNASTAEETASASEEMSAQAKQMQYIVKDMMSLVGTMGSEMTFRSEKGKHAGPAKHSSDYNNMESSSKSEMLAEQDHYPQNDGYGQSFSTTPASPSTATGYKGKEVKPEEVLPLDDKELNDF